MTGVEPYLGSGNAGFPVTDQTGNKLRSWSEPLTQLTFVQLLCSLGPGLIVSLAPYGDCSDRTTTSGPNDNNGKARRQTRLEPR